MLFVSMLGSRLARQSGSFLPSLLYDPGGYMRRGETSVRGPDLLAMANTVFAFSPRTRKTMLRCDESTLSFSRKNGLSTPYSWRVENLTRRFSGPARAFSRTRFFFPRTWWLRVSMYSGTRGRHYLTPSSRSSRSRRAFSEISAALNGVTGAIALSPQRWQMLDAGRGMMSLPRALGEQCGQCRCAAGN